MTIDGLLDLTLREILDNYCVVCNLECGYCYGVFKQEDVEKIFEKYNVAEYEIAFAPESLLDEERLPTNEIRSYETLETIINNLGISEKDD